MDPGESKPLLPPCDEGLRTAVSRTSRSAGVKGFLEDQSSWRGRRNCRGGRLVAAMGVVFALLLLACFVYVVIPTFPAGYFDDSSKGSNKKSASVSSTTATSSSSSSTFQVDNYDAATSTSDETLCINDHVAPVFFMVGSQKAGTTSFYDDASGVLTDIDFGGYFEDTGSVTDDGYTLPFSSVKEKHFFDQDYRYETDGFDAYLDLFSLCNASSSRVVGSDFTPAYLKRSDAALRIKESYGDDHNDIHLFMILREPVARLQSEYYEFKSGETDTFQDYVKSQISAANNCSDQGYPAWPPCGEDWLVWHDAITNGLYGLQILYWLDHFEPNQFHIIPFEEYFLKDPDSIMQSTADILGVKKEGTLDKPSQANIVSHGSIPDDLDADTLADLVDYYQESNRLVYTLIDFYNLDVLTADGSAPQWGFLDYNFSRTDYPYGDDNILSDNFYSYALYEPHALYSYDYTTPPTAVPAPSPSAKSPKPSPSQTGAPSPKPTTSPTADQTMPPSHPGGRIGDVVDDDDGIRRRT